LSPQCSRAAQWWLHSGIQNSSGGVARYYRTDLEQNLPISTEITGYAMSALVYLHSLSADPEYLNRARSAARFLADTAWEPQSSTLPFELDPPAFTYFFDCGIVARGLLAAWRSTGIDSFRDTAAALGASMARDFVSPSGDIHPILALPSKTPVGRDPPVGLALPAAIN